MSIVSPGIIWTGLVTLLACLVYVYMGINVGRMRGKHKVDAPVMTGPGEFERSVRVQMNTLEWLPVFFAVLWLAALYFGGYIPPIIGLIWVIGRIFYMQGYMVEAGKRSLGFTIQAFSALALLAIAAYGLVTALLVV